MHAEADSTTPTSLPFFQSQLERDFAVSQLRFEFGSVD
jgi:hypothetical protein